jgi:hypothetical protein
MKVVCVVVILFGLFSGPLFAQVEEIRAHGGTVSCSACFSMALAGVKQIPGVTDASGDLREGWIRVIVNPKQAVSLKDVMERIRLAGFKDTAQFSLTAVGRMEQKENRLVFVIPNQDEVFFVNAGDRAKMAMNTAASKAPVRASGEISVSGNQYDLKIEKMQKQ